MKVRPAAMILAVLFSQAGLAQEETATPLPEDDAAVMTAPDSTAPARPTFIPGSLEVLPFTPPEPVVRKLPPPIRIDASVILPSKNGTTLTLQRGEPLHRA